MSKSAIEQEFDDLLEEYLEMFGDRYPNLPPRGSYADMITEMKACLKAGKNVVEMGFYSIDLDIMH